MLVKICGMTSVDDAVHAVDCGAEMIGLIFVPSSVRRIDLDTARAIAQTVAKRCQAVAVFQDQTIERITEIVQQLKVPLVQLHGSESPAQIDELAEQLPRFRFIKAMPVTGPDIIERLHQYYFDNVQLQRYRPSNLANKNGDKKIKARNNNSHPANDRDKQ